MVIYGEISSGHARAIAAVTDADTQIDLAQQVIANDLNVRQLEQLISEGKKQKKSKKTEKISLEPNLKAQLKTIEKDLMGYFGTKVKISTGKNKGKIEIEYYDSEGLEKLINLMKK